MKKVDKQQLCKMELILRSNTFFEKLGINAKEDRVKNNSVKKN